MVSEQIFVGGVAQIVILRPLFCCQCMKATAETIDMDEDEHMKPKAHEVGMPLDAISVDELHERIGLLEQEIERLRAEIQTKQSSKAAANAVFKI